MLLSLFCAGFLLFCGSISYTVFCVMWVFCCQSQFGSNSLVVFIGMGHFGGARTNECFLLTAQSFVFTVFFVKDLTSL